MTDCIIERFEAYIDIDELLEKYFDFELTHARCRACPGYQSTWACPELSFDPKEFVGGFSRFHLIVDRINNSGANDIDEAQECLFSKIRGFDKEMRELEALLPEAYALAAQECMECTTCARLSGLPCIHPDRMRFGPEAIGIIVSRMISDKLGFPILWSDGTSIPEYYLLVGGVLEK